MPTFKENVERLREQWTKVSEQLSKTQKLALAGSVASVLVGFAVLIALTGQVDYRPVFTRLELEDAASITTTLKEKQVPYKLDDNGTAILVPSDRVHDVRLMLAGEGLPQGGAVGFELLDRSDPWGGKREHEIAYRRALEGELSRTISRIGAVRGAKVHIALPRESLFVDREQKPTASVLLYMEKGQSLTAKQVKGMSRLVAASVERLAPNEVTIVDDEGNLLSKSEDDQGVGTAMEYRQKVERELTRAALRILEPVVGAGHVMVEVRADVDFSQVTETEEKFDDDKVVVAREQRSSEKRAGAGPAVGGVPGARAGAPQGLVQVGAGPGGSERKKEDLSYIVPKTTRRVQKAIGGIDRLSIAVLVDGVYKTVAAVPAGGAGAADGDDDAEDADEEGEPAAAKTEYVPRSAEELKRFEALVRKAVGFSETRGDQIEVVNEAFRPLDEGVEVVGPSVWTEIRPVMPWLVALIIAVLLVLFAVRPLVRFAIFGSAPADDEDRPDWMLEDGEGTELLGDGTKAEGYGFEGGIETGPDPTAFLKQFAQQDPARVAQVLRRWIAKG